MSTQEQLIKYKDEKELLAPPDHPGLAFKPPNLYLAALLAGGLVEAFYPIPIFTVADAYPVFRWWMGGVGLLLIILGFLLAGWSVACFKAVGTPYQPWKAVKTIVSDGPYRYSRNPMYVALSLVYAGIGLAAGSFWVLILLLPVLWVMEMEVIRREEAYLERKFGQEYLDFKHETPRWF